MRGMKRAHPLVRLKKKARGINYSSLPPWAMAKSAAMRHLNPGQGPPYRAHNASRKTREKMRSSRVCYWYTVTNHASTFYIRVLARPSPYTMPYPQPNHRNSLLTHRSAADALALILRNSEAQPARFFGCSYTATHKLCKRWSFELRKKLNSISKISIMAKTLNASRCIAYSKQLGWPYS